MQPYLEQNVNEWRDDTTMRAFFAPLSKSLQEHSPETYAARVSFWKRLLNDTAKRGLLGISRFSVKADSLPALFERQQVRPLSLPHVINSLMEEKQWIPISTYVAQCQQSKQQSSLVGTVARVASTVVHHVVARPLTWTARKASQTVKEWMNGGDDGFEEEKESIKLPQEDLILVSELEEAAKTVMQKHWSQSHQSTDHWQSLDEFMSLLPSSISISHDRDVQLLLLTLIRMGYLHSVPMPPLDKELPTEMVLSLAPSAHLAPSAIGEVQENVVHLKRTRASVHAHAEALSSKAEEWRLEARNCIRQGKRPAAAALLKRAKRADMEASKRFQVHETLDALLQRIAATSDDAAILQAYQLGADALKKSLSIHALTPELVDKTMDDVDEALTAVNEVDMAVQQGTESLNANMDEEALEKELEALVDAEALNVVSQLPSVPTNQPAVVQLTADEESMLAEMAALNVQEKEEKSELLPA